MKQKKGKLKLFDDRTAKSAVSIWGEKKYSKALSVLSLLCVVIHLTYAGFYRFSEINFMAVFNIISSLFYGLMFFLSLKKKFLPVGMGLCLEIMLHVGFSIIFVGWGCGFELQLFAVMAISFFLPYKKSSSIYFISLFSIAEFFLLYAETNIFDPLYDGYISSSLKTFVYLLNCCVTIVPLFIELFLFRVSFDKSAKVLTDKNKDLSVLATVDPLTKLYNRRYIEAKFEEAYYKRENNEEPFCIVIGDIDDFKSINDTYGHDCGDYVLKTISELIRSSLRTTDCISRWGGEEIMILLNSTDVGSAIQTIERIRIDISEHEFSYENKAFGMTMTFGVSWSRSDIPTMLKQADDHLYYGKNNGKNQVVYDIGN